MKTREQLEKMFDEEKEYLNHLIYEESFSDIIEYLNPILLDRYNKGKEEGIKYMQERLCTKCGRFHSEGDICEELLPF